MAQKVTNIKRVEAPIRIENAKIIWTNFAGAKGRYNQPGFRNFHLVIEDEELADNLIRDGWNLKRFKPREDGSAPDGYHMQVVVSFENRVPKVMLITKHSQTFLNEDTIELLDSADIISCDIEVRPFNWEQSDGRHGVKGYLQTLYVTIQEDPFAEKYRHIPMTSTREVEGDVVDDN